MKSSPKPDKRANHKARLLQERLNAEKDKRHPEPMSLFHQRERDGEVPSSVRPKPQVTKGMIDKAATAMAEWDNSDPFAYARTALHVKQGFLNPREVVEEMQKRTVARRVARAREVERMKEDAGG